MDKLRSMEVLVAVAEHGSFTAAAEALGMSSGMAGKHIRQLEEAIGTRLFTRSTRRLALTEIGTRYCERSRAILAEVAAADDDAAALRGGPRGTLRVSCTVAFACFALAGALVDYLAAHPEVQVDLVADDRIVDVVGQGFDAAFRVGPLDDSGLVARPLQPYRMLLCGAPAYLARAGRPETPAALAGHARLVFTYGGHDVRWALDGGLPASGPVRLRANNGIALRTAALAGFGLVMLPAALVADDIAAGRLVSLLDSFQPPPRPMHLVTVRDRRMPPKLRSFVDFMVGRFGAGAAG
ncbi:LysR family transcriptional regulator [Derxia gummosa]|uniref:LysR family transcriptional regulator n=1 Tax=Derxia gummosa DSM 723 TaxID=1121388 RepID=A0A8B6X5B4_9BURK|nr:LysR family transcriptional regulator [Derxia gummosa]